jgi:DNA polymerase III epsilon subunit-like protein
METDTDDWTGRRLVAVDLEGNGHQPPGIVEIAIVEIINGEVVQPLHSWLVRPEQPIIARVARIHGIHNADVASCPTFDAVASEIRAHLGADIFVAHCAHVDLAVLKRQLSCWTPDGVIDTHALAKRLLPGSKSFSLSQLVSDLHLEPLLSGQPHRAGYDALAAAFLFLRLARTPEGQPRKLSELLLANTPAKKNGPAQGSFW